MREPVDRSFTARLDCHYLVQIPDTVNDRTPLVLTLHGFGGNPEAMLALTDRLFDARPVIAALQGPFQFFLSPAVRDVGYGWITNRRPSESIRLHHEMVSKVLDEVGGEFGIPAERRLLVGFSQSVAMNYRFASTRPAAARGVIAICGGLPGDWDVGSYQPIQASVLHIATRQDEYYRSRITEAYPESLRKHAADFEFHLIEGGHRIPAAGRDLVTPWMQRVLA